MLRRLIGALLNKQTLQNIFWLFNLSLEWLCVIFFSKFQSLSITSFTNKIRKIVHQIISGLPDLQSRNMGFYVGPTRENMGFYGLVLQKYGLIWVAVFQKFWIINNLFTMPDDTKAYKSLILLFAIPIVLSLHRTTTFHMVPGFSLLVRILKVGHKIINWCCYTYIGQ